MSDIIDISSRRPPSNRVFKAVDREDYTKLYHFEAFRDEEDSGVHLNFLDPPDASGMSRVRDSMWIGAAQCREFGNALIRAADLAELQQR